MGYIDIFFNHYQFVWNYALPTTINRCWNVFNIEQALQWVFADGLGVNLRADPETIGLAVLIFRQSCETIINIDQQSLSFLTLFKSETEPEKNFISILREGAFSRANKHYFGRLGQCFQIWYDDTFYFSPKIFALIVKINLFH